MHDQASWFTLISDLANYATNLYDIPTLLTSAAVLALGLTVLCHERYRLVGFSPAIAAKEILKAMGNALIVVDGAGMIQIVNRVACELFSKPEAHLVGSFLTELGLPGHVLAVFSTPPVDGHVRDLEFSLQRDEGRAMNLSATASVMRDPSGQPLGTVWILTDITERKLAEERLQDAHAALKRSHVELQATQLQLIQAARLESVGRLAAGVAHEVKNPLAIISMGVEYLAKALTNGNGHTRTILTDVQGAVRRADAVIHGLLDFAAAQTLQMRPESVNAAIEQALLLVKHELERTRVEVVKELADRLPSCPLDRVRVEQVFVNLFMNAIQAMPSGGQLVVRSRARRLTEVGPLVGQRATDRFRVGETVVEVQVEDAGGGIAAEHLEKVFDPFFTTKPTGQGTGLGLAVTRSIIELHRGDIRAENRREGGVRVTMLFKTDGGDGDGQASDPDRR